MAWSTPNTWATNDVPSAAQLNQDLRDNPLALYNAFSGQIILTDAPIVAAYAVGAVNKAHLSMMTVLRNITVTSVGYYLGGGAGVGNVDIGIYNSSYSRLWSRGSTATPGSTGGKTVSISAGSPTTLTLAPGVYWFAIASDSTSPQFVGINTSIPGLSVSKTSSFALPSSISSPASNTTELVPWGAIIS